MVWQATSCGKIFEVGFPHLILGKITMWPAIRVTKEQQHGSFGAMHSRNGDHPASQVLSYGSTGNVSRFPVIRLYEY